MDKKLPERLNISQELSGELSGFSLYFVTLFQNIIIVSQMLQVNYVREIR